MTDRRERERDSLDAYGSAVERRLQDRGYSERPDGPEGYQARAFHRRKLSLTKFGLVDYFVVLGEFEDPSPRTAEAFSKAAFRYGLSNKSIFPRGLGGNLVVYPVVVGREVPERTLNWAESYSNKHWSSFEFPAVVDVSRGGIFYNGSTPLWGWIYYRGIHKFADRCLTPRGSPASGHGGQANRTTQSAGAPEGTPGGEPHESERRDRGREPPRERGDQGRSRRRSKADVRESEREKGRGESGEPTYCTKCGAEVGADWEYCESCGVRL